MPTSDYELFLLQLELEAKSVTSEGEIFRIPGDEADDIPQVAVFSIAGEAYFFTSRDLPPALAAAVRRHRPAAILGDPSPIEALLSGPGPAQGRRFRSHTIPPGHPLSGSGEVQCLSHGHVRLLRNCFDPGFAEFAARRPVWAMIVDGEVVSACTSVRENAVAAECWVATDPAHQRRGYGRSVVTAWARGCHRSRRVAFYSYEETNLASAALARHLELPQWCRLIAFD
jgi:GNAT superfamily N-acetyltransferase